MTISPGIAVSAVSVELRGGEPLNDQSSFSVFPMAFLISSHISSATSGEGLEQVRVERLAESFSINDVMIFFLV